MVDPSRIADKLVSNVDKIAGALTFMTDNGIQNTLDLVNAAMDGTIHMPPIKETIQDVISDPNLIGLGVMALGTYVLNEAGIPYMSKVSRVATKAAIGYAGGKLASRVIYRSAHAGGGSYAPGGQSGATSDGARLAMTNPVTYNYGGDKIVDPTSAQNIDVFSRVGI